MKLEVILILTFCVVNVVRCDDEYKDLVKEYKDLLKYEEGGNKKDSDSINNIFKKIQKKYKNIDDEDSVGSGSDDEDSETSGSGEEESGEGSGAVLPTKRVTTTDKKEDETSPAVVDINFVSSTTTEKTTTLDNSVEEIPNETGNMDKSEEGGVTNNQVARRKKDTTPKKKSGVNFTVGIIIGVVVGAILAILIIVFLVYRLRKKDEGSYSLDEQSSTTYLRADTDSPTKGKEYFA